MGSLFSGPPKPPSPPPIKPPVPMPDPLIQKQKEQKRITAQTAQTGRDSTFLGYYGDGQKFGG